VYLSLGAGAYEPRKVRIGRIGDHLAEVLDGLKPGERVVTQAAFLLDAQSQLQSGHSGESDPEATTTLHSRSPAPPPLAEFLQLSADLSEALASDQLEVFQKTLKRFPPRQEALRQWASQTVTNLPETLQKSIASISIPSVPNGPSSLAEARKWFLDQSRTSVELARWAHRQGWNAGVRSFECPMVDRAIPSAPKRAGWLQKGAEVRNPFFGAEMIDCGLELKEKP
jgi:Cu(I)/Ag(I) efflux system membrane fusion protein